jgi:ADP-ribosylglycohydrolase
MALPSDHDVRMRRVRLALDGLSIGDAFGERFYIVPGSVEAAIEARILPERPWEYTDDTAMALAIAETLDRHGAIDRDALAQALAARWQDDPGRGYGPNAHWILASVASGLPWAEAVTSVHDGEGSLGSGAAMRVAPVGAYFADDFDKIVREARASAEPTHAHPEGQAGAIAVAVAAGLAARMGEGKTPKSAKDLLDAALAHTPEGDTRAGIARARAMLDQSTAAPQAARALGSGAKVLASDTVPFALYCAARGLSDYVDTMWSTVSGLGDRDTTCAIAGSIVALAVGSVPAQWLDAREPLR